MTQLPFERSPSEPPVVRVLVLNAHDDTRVMLMRLLARLGFFTEGAADLKQAYGFCQGAPFDLIICETWFCDGACVDLLRRQRAAHGTRGLAFSADAYEHQVAAGLAAGFDGYLAQPATIEDLSAAIHRVLSGRGRPVHDGGNRGSEAGPWFA